MYLIYFMKYKKNFYPHLNIHDYDSILLIDSYRTLIAWRVSYLQGGYCTHNYFLNLLNLDLFKFHLMNKFHYLLFSCLFGCFQLMGQTPKFIYPHQFPYAQSFEDPNDVWYPDTRYPVRWQRQQGPTPTPNTGPNAASAGNSYLYLEATNQVGSAVLFTDVFFFGGLQNPELSFDYHMQGSHITHLTVLTEDGYLLYRVIGDQGPGWKTATVDLTDYTQNYGYRTPLKIIAGVNGLYLGDECDIAIDNFVIRDRPACFNISIASNNASCATANDAQASLIINPPSTTGLTINWSTGASTSSIQNLAPGNYGVTVTDQNGCSASEQFTIYGPRALDAELYITPTSDPSHADGRIYAQVSGGRAPYQMQWLNGSTHSVLNNVSTGYQELSITDANGCTLSLPTFVPVLTRYNRAYSNFPYTLNFEGNLGRFKQETYDDLNWLKRSSATPTNNTGPSAPAQGNYYRYLEASGSGSPFKVGTLLSKRYFNITGLTNPELYFQYHMNGTDADVLFVQTSTDGGFTWRENCWSVKGNQGNNWHDAIIDLSDYQVTSLLVRIVGRTGASELSDVAIDHLQIRSAGTTPFTENQAIPELAIANATTSNVTEDLSQSFYFFPNPVKEELQVEWNGAVQKLALIDSNGKVLQRFVPQGDVLHINLGQFTPGIYYLKTTDEKGRESIHKVMKQ